MSKKLFTADEIRELERNPYVKKVSEKAITYTNEFRYFFVQEYQKGLKAREVFEKAGFDVNVLGKKRCEQSATRWMAIYRQQGIPGLRDTRPEKSKYNSSKVVTKDLIIRQQEDKIKLLEEQIALLKKSEMIEGRLVNSCVNLSNLEKYKLIHETVQSDEYHGTVSFCCDILGVHRSGYYNYLKKHSYRIQYVQADLEARDYILMAMNYKGYSKGSRAIKMVLESVYGINFNRKKIQRIMRKYNITCSIRKANPYRRMAKATQEHRVVPNRLKRQFKKGLPGQVLLTDITYIKYGKSKTAYLSVIKDNASADILAHHTSDKITLDIATRTIDKLIKWNYKELQEGVYIHSDQGFHYTNPRYQKLLKQYNIGQSMSRRGNCWDNASQESFFGHMKDEVDFKSCNTLEEVKRKVNHYIDYYNNHRYQWGLKKMTPKQYRSHLLQKTA